MVEKDLPDRGRSAAGKLVMVVLLVLAVAGSARAQGVPTGQYRLVYKFRPGQENQYLLTQSTAVTSQMPNGTGGSVPTRTETRTKLWILMKVLRVTQDGSAEIEQKLANYRKDIPIGRQKLVVTANERGIVKTLDGKIFINELPGIGAILGDMTDAMHERLFVRGVRLTISPAGEQKALSTANADGGQVGIEALSGVNEGLSLVFPDKPLTVGDSWSDEKSVQLPQGSLKANVKTTLLAVERVDGKPYARISRTLTSTVENEQAESGSTSSVSVTGTFTYLFAIDGGYIEQADYDIVQTSTLPDLGASVRSKARGKIERRKL